MTRFLGERRGDRENRGGARRVVVRTGMHFSRVLFRRERIACFAVAEMIVVRADGDPRLRRCRHGTRGRQIRDDVVARSLLTQHLGVDVNRRVGNREPGRVRIRVVQRLLHILELLASAGEDPISHLTGDRRGDDAGSGECGVERHRRQLAGVRRPRTGDDDHGLRAVLARGHRLVAEIGIAREDTLGLPSPRINVRNIRPSPRSCWGGWQIGQVVLASLRGRQAAHQPGTPRLARLRADRQRLAHEADSQADCDQPYLPVVVLNPKSKIQNPKLRSD